MIVGGMDVGGKNVHLVIKKDKQILGKGTAPSGIKKGETVEALYGQVLKQAGLSIRDVERVVSTGSAAKRVAFANRSISDAAALAKGVLPLYPKARTVIDVGAEESRAIKISPDGKILDFALNDKCAAGTGTFVETLSRALETSVEELSKIALDSTRSILMNAQCVVFGESEVVSLIHQNISRADISRAVMDAIAGRVGSIARVVGLEREVVLVGGMAKNIGFINSLEKNIGMDIIIPDDPDYMGAFGAAEAAFSDVME